MLLVVGAVCLSWYALDRGRAALYQFRLQTELNEILEAGRVPAAPGRRTTASAHRNAGLIGQLEIARLGLSAVVIEGDDRASLQIAVGHLPGTPLPGENGNSAMAGHRDTFFHPLENVRLGDEIRVITPEADYRYRVQSILVVDPDDVWVLAPTPRPSLTLVTCYPLTYIGSAPRRLVVRADRLP